jgi:hypothetical protein
VDAVPEIDLRRHHGLPKQPEISRDRVEDARNVLKEGDEVSTRMWIASSSTIQPVS